MFGELIIDELIATGLIEEDEDIEFVDYNDMPIYIEADKEYAIQGVYHNETTATVAVIPLEV